MFYFCSSYAARPNTASSLTWLSTDESENTRAQASLLAEDAHASAAQLKPDC